MYAPGASTFLDPSYSQFSLYAQNLVRYYNGGGFWAQDGYHVSASTTPVKWWGIYNEPNGGDLTPEQYVAMYNMLVPAMQSVDPTLKFIAVELSGTPQGEESYIPAFVDGVDAQVDALAIHFYSTWDQADTDSTVMATVPGFASGVRYLYSQLQTRTDLANVPVWVTENNVNADFALSDGTSRCNPGQPYVPDLRDSGAFFAAWRPYVFSQLGKAGARALYQWNFDGIPQYGEMVGATGQLQISYWVDFWLAHYFPESADAEMLQTTNSDPGDIEELAVEFPDGSVRLMLVNHAVENPTDNNGRGASQTVDIDVSALGNNFSSATTLTIDGNTDTINGPLEAPVPVSDQFQVVFDGYGVWFLTLKH